MDTPHRHSTTTTQENNEKKSRGVMMGLSVGQAVEENGVRSVKREKTRSNHKNHGHWFFCGLTMFFLSLDRVFLWFDSVFCGLTLFYGLTVVFVV